MKMKQILALTYALGILVFSHAATAQNTAMDIGEGAELCAKYAKKSMSKKNNSIIWVQGFFSAFNALDSKTKNITGDKDYYYVLKWLTDYCKANPTMYFGEAVRVLIEELYPNRIPNTPSENPMGTLILKDKS
ncbi:MAG TPA: hypothetical protein DF383_07510 [Deltaproteobacteria bacterium]|nr:hypothetical protein [Deltaproteobacteria bacterium]